MKSFLMPGKRCSMQIELSASSFQESFSINKQYFSNANFCFVTTLACGGYQTE